MASWSYVVRFNKIIREPSISKKDQRVKPRGLLLLPQGVRRIVLDVLKPHSPRMTDLALMITRYERVSGLNISLKEVDQNTESITITIEGDDLNYDSIKEILAQAGAVIHSIDQVVAGRSFVEEVSLQPENT